MQNLPRVESVLSAWDEVKTDNFHNLGLPTDVETTLTAMKASAPAEWNVQLGMAVEAVDKWAKKCGHLPFPTVSTKGVEAPSFSKETEDPRVRELVNLLYHLVGLCPT